MAFFRNPSVNQRDHLPALYVPARRQVRRTGCTPPHNPLIFWALCRNSHFRIGNSPVPEFHLWMSPISGWPRLWQSGHSCWPSAGDCRRWRSCMRMRRVFPFLRSSDSGRVFMLPHVQHRNRHGRNHGCGGRHHS